MEPSEANVNADYGRQRASEIEQMTTKKKKAKDSEVSSPLLSSSSAITTTTAAAGSSPPVSKSSLPLSASLEKKEERVIRLLQWAYVAFQPAAIGILLAALVFHSARLASGEAQERMNGSMCSAGCGRERMPARMDASKKGDLVTAALGQPLSFTLTKGE